MLNQYNTVLSSNKICRAVSTGDFSRLLLEGSSAGPSPATLFRVSSVLLSPLSIISSRSSVCVLGRGAGAGEFRSKSAES